MVTVMTESGRKRSRVGLMRVATLCSGESEEARCDGKWGLEEYTAYIYGSRRRCWLRCTLRSFVTQGGHEHRCRAPPVPATVGVCLTIDEMKPMGGQEKQNTVIPKNRWPR
jgi:hypothetical protein